MTKPMPPGPARDAVLTAREALLKTLEYQVETVLEALDKSDAAIAEELKELNLLLGFDANADL